MPPLVERAIKERLGVEVLHERREQRPGEIGLLLHEGPFEPEQVRLPCGAFLRVADIDRGGPAECAQRQRLIETGRDRDPEEPLLREPTVVELDQRIVRSREFASDIRRSDGASCMKISPAGVSVRIRATACEVSAASPVMTTSVLFCEHSLRKRSTAFGMGAKIGA